MKPLPRSPISIKFHQELYQIFRKANINFYDCEITFRDGQVLIKNLKIQPEKKI
jgi:hypothetical protein